MPHTIFILGTDPQQCKELREILQERITDSVVTTHSEDAAPSIHAPDTVIITSEEKNTGILYRRLLNKLEEQVHRAQLLGDLIRLFSSALPIEELLQRVVSRSTEVLGDSSFIILSSESGQMKLEAAFSNDQDRLIKMLISTVNMASLAETSDLLSSVMERKEPIILPHLSRVGLRDEFRTFVDKHAIGSLLAVPIQTKDVVLGAFVALANNPAEFRDDDLSTALAVADFTAIALENAGLFAELQRSAITDSLTGLYNPGFFNEVLGREAARADRYMSPLSLLMIDIDSFKLVNDTYGHVVGNKVLTQIAQVLERAVRNTDFVFRCGGDEFGVILPATSLEGAMHVAEKILFRVQSGDILQSIGYSGPVTVSIGVSEHHRGNHVESLVAEADQALYAAKRSTKNCALPFRAGVSGTTQ